MADFDPDAYLSEKAGTATATFNPDSYLAEKTQTASQPSSERPVLSGIGAGIWRAIPKSLGDVFGMVSPAQQGIGELTRDVRFIGDVTGGHSIEESLKRDLPDVAAQRSALRGELGAREQAAEITGLGIQAATLALPFLKSVRGKIPSLSETVRGVQTEPPIESGSQIADTAAAQEVIKNATQERQVQENIQRERTGDDASRTSTEAGAGGGVQPTTESAAQPQEKIVSTAVQDGLALYRGSTLNEPHDVIGERHGIGSPSEETRGFMVRDAQGNERFVGREEAAKVANASGQVKPENAGTTELHSEQLQPEGGVSEEVQKGEGKRQEILAEPAAAVSGTEMPPAAAPPSTTSSTEPHVSAIANRFTQERVKSGEIGEIIPGGSVSRDELVQSGLQMPPEEINQHISDVMQGTGDIVKQGQALRANEARLSEISNRLSKEAEGDPTNMEKKLAADNAFKDLTDFHNGPLATLKNKWHLAGKEMQGEIPVDLSTFNGMREAWLKDIGTPPPPEVEPMLRETANKVASANGEADAAIKNVAQSIDKSTANRKLPTAEQARESILQRLRERTPCN